MIFRLFVVVAMAASRSSSEPIIGVGRRSLQRVCSDQRLDELWRSACQSRFWAAATAP